MENKHYTILEIVTTPNINYVHIHNVYHSLDEAHDEFSKVLVRARRYAQENNLKELNTCNAEAYNAGCEEWCILGNRKQSSSLPHIWVEIYGC